MTLNLEVLTEHLPPQNATIGLDPTIALLRQWRDEDATADPGEIHAAEAELDELKAGLNANRSSAGARMLFP